MALRFATRSERWSSGSFFFQAEDGIRDLTVTGVQTCALPILTLIAFRFVTGTVQGAYFGAGAVVAGYVYGPGKDRKSTRLNSSHSQISYAVFCLKKKNKRLESSIINLPSKALWSPPLARHCPH